MEIFEIEDNERHWVIANNKKEAIEILKEHFQQDFDSGCYSVRTLKDYEPLEIVDDGRFGLHKTSKLVCRWKEKEAVPILLASTVYP